MKTVKSEAEYLAARAFDSTEVLYDGNYVYNHEYWYSEYVPEIDRTFIWWQTDVDDSASIVLGGWMHGSAGGIATGIVETFNVGIWEATHNPINIALDHITTVDEQ
jgi:hypothetical protein